MYRLNGYKAGIKRRAGLALAFHRVKKKRWSEWKRIKELLNMSNINARNGKRWKLIRKMNDPYEFYQKYKLKIQNNMIKREN